MESWFKQLREYFPAKEMKSESHMKCLFEEKRHSYKLEQGPAFTLVYYETDDFLFVDYILVGSSARGSGLGSKVMDRLKSRGKLIVLEVDPVTQADPESGKRVRFYQRLGFKKAPSIQYVRRHPVTGERNEMDIFFWSPSNEAENSVMDKMKRVFKEVHAYKNEEFYNTRPQPAEEVLQWKSAEHVQTK